METPATPHPSQRQPTASKTASASRQGPLQPRRTGGKVGSHRSRQQRFVPSFCSIGTHTPFRSRIRRQLELCKKFLCCLLACCSDILSFVRTRTAGFLPPRPQISEAVRRQRSCQGRPSLCHRGTHSDVPRPRIDTSEAAAAELDGGPTGPGRALGCRKGVLVPCFFARVD